MSSRTPKDGAKSPGTSPGSGASTDPSSSTPPAAPTSDAPPSNTPASDVPTTDPPASDASADEAAAQAAREALMRAEEDAARARAEAEAAAAEAAAAPPRATLRAPFGSDLTSVAVAGVEYSVDERGYFDVAPEHADAIRVLLAAHWPKTEDDE